MICVALAIASFLIGGWILRPLGLAQGPQGLLCRFLVGAYGCGVLVLITGMRSLNMAVLALAAIAVAGFGLHVFAPPSKTTGLPLSRWRPHGGVEWLAAAALVCVGALSLLGALAPVTSWDACVAHIALAKDYARQGSLAAIAGNEYTAYPHLVHTLFAAAYAAGNERMVTLINWLLAALALGSVAHCGCTVLRERRCAWIAAAIFATAPIYFDQAQAPSIDVAFTGYAVAALAALFEWRDDGPAQGGPRDRWLWLAAFLAGASCGVRHTGYLVCVLLAIGVWFGTRERRIRTSLVFAAIAALAAAPWMLRTALITGNPVYPFLTNLFDAGPMQHWNVTTLGTHPSAADTHLLLLLRYPWDIVMRPQLFDGWTKSPGGLVLILGLPGLFLAGARARRIGLYSAAGLASFFYFERLSRYVLPFLAPMMAVAAATTCRLAPLRRLVTAILAVIFVYGVALDAIAVHFKAKAALGLEARNEYLKRRVERYEAFQWANEHVPKNDLVYSFDRRTYYFDMPTYQNDEPLRRLQASPIEAQVAWLRDNNIRWVFIPVTYMEEASGYRDSLLKVANAWRNDGRHFLQRAVLDVPRPRSSGKERVEVYEVRHD